MDRSHVRLAHATGPSSGAGSARRIPPGNAEVVTRGRSGAASASARVDRSAGGIRLMRVALVHDWLIAMRGGERVLEQLALMLPDAEIFTLLCRRDALSPILRERVIHTSPLSSLPGAARFYRHALPLFPMLIERFDLRGFDLVISSSHCVAKGVRVPAGVPHLCYCHTPMRYLYDQSEAYRERFSPLVRAGFQLLRPQLRRWDCRTANRVTKFVANSEHVRERIRTLYGRDAIVVHPPVDVDRFAARNDRDDYYVTI